MLVEFKFGIFEMRAYLTPALIALYCAALTGLPMIVSDCPRVFRRVDPSREL